MFRIGGFRALGFIEVGAFTSHRLSLSRASTCFKESGNMVSSSTIGLGVFFGVSF